MAFPTVVGTAVWQGSLNVQKAQMPAGIVAGDLILVFWARSGGTSQATLEPGWTALANAAGWSQGARCAYMIAAGTESSALLDFSAFPSGSANAGSTTIVVRNYGDYPAAAAYVSVAGATTVNPPSLTSGFGAVDTLWLAWAGGNNQAGAPVAAVPANYGSTVEVDRVSIAQALSSRNLNAATDDPGVFDWAGATAPNAMAITVAIPGPMLQTGSDTGTGVDNNGTLSAFMTSSDTGAGADSNGALSVLLTSSDAGAGVDAGESLSVFLTSSDTGTGVDANGVLVYRVFLDSDSAVGLDFEAVDRLEPPPPVIYTIGDFIGAAIHIPLVRAEILEPDLSLPPDEWPVVLTLTGTDGVTLGGSVAIAGRTSPIRTMRLDLSNRDGAFSPGQGRQVYLDTMVRVWAGQRTVQGDFLEPVGTFLADQPGSDVSADGKARASIGGTDRSKRAATSGFTQPTTYGKANRVADVIRAIAQDAFLGTIDALYDLDDGGRTLSVDRTFTTGTYRWTAMQQIASDFALSLSFDPMGVLVLRPSFCQSAGCADLPTHPAFVDVLLGLREPDWRYTPGSAGTLLKVGKTLSSDALFNHVLVIAENAAQKPIRAEAFVTNPDSPLHPDRVGDRLLPPVTLAGLSSRDQVAAKAVELLYANGLEEERLILEGVADPRRKAGDMLEVVEPLSAVTDYYLLDNVNLTLGSSRMQMQTRKVRQLTI